MSLFYFQLRRSNIDFIGHLREDQARQLTRFVYADQLGPWIIQASLLRVPAPGQEANLSIWHNGTLKNINSLTSKDFRVLNEDKKPVTNLKLGIIINENESRNLFFKAAKLKSTKLKSILYRTLHGDIYSNDRLLRFGLRDNNDCSRCGNPDSRVHRVLTCPKIEQIWSKLRYLMGHGEPNQESEHVEWLTRGNTTLTELTIKAEILRHALWVDNTLMALPPEISLRIILTNLKKLESGSIKDDISALLTRLRDTD